MNSSVIKKTGQCQCIQKVLVLKKLDDNWLDHNIHHLAHFLTWHFQNNHHVENSSEANCRRVENAKDRFDHWKQ